MTKDTITFYLPASYHEAAKKEIEKLKKTLKTDISLSQFYSCLAQLYIDLRSAKESAISSSGDKKKITIYLDSKIKKKIKLWSAKEGITVSAMFLKALDLYFNYPNKIKPVLEENLQQENIKTNSTNQKSLLGFYIEPSLDKKLKTHGVKSNKTRSEIVLEAVKAAGEKDIKSFDFHGRMSKKSGIRIDKQKSDFLKQRANSLKISVSELINRSLHLYL